MKIRYFSRLFFLTVTIICLTWTTQVLADSATLEFETQVLDLDTGTVTEQTPDLRSSTEGVDILIGYHADRTPHAVVITAGEGVTFAVMNGVSYDSVTAGDVAGLGFSAEIIDHSIEATDTVVVKTDEGAVFKLGNTVEDDTAATFSYELLQ
jgi:hypothetical protein